MRFVWFLSFVMFYDGMLKGVLCWNRDWYLNCVVMNWWLFWIENSWYLRIAYFLDCVIEVFKYWYINLVKSCWIVIDSFISCRFYLVSGNGFFLISIFGLISHWYWFWKWISPWYRYWNDCLIVIKWNEECLWDVLFFDIIWWKKGCYGTIFL